MANENAHEVDENEPRSLDLLFEALAHPRRRAMVERLSRGSAALDELAGPLGLTGLEAAGHLGTLADCGLVRRERSGEVDSYRLVPSALRQAGSWLQDRDASWRDRRLDRLQDYLEDGRASQ